MKAQYAYDDADAEYWIAVALTGTFGLVLYAIGRLHMTTSTFARLGEVYVLGGVLIVLPIIYGLTFVDVWDELIGQRVESYQAPFGVYALIGLAAVLAAAQIPLRWRSDAETLDVAAQLAVLSLAVTAVTWPASTGYALIFNAAFFLLAAAMVARGYLSSDERYINVGLAAVAVGLVSRYIDTFWSLLTGSAFFIVGGVLLLALAFGIEHVRRGLLRAMDEGQQELPPPGGQESVA
jgi:uncharacterized membrane protein